MGCDFSRFTRTDRREQTQAASVSSTPERLAAYDRLRAAGVPFCVWFEDALALLGVPTLTFHLYLLVSDVGAAVEILHAAGYRQYPPSLAIEGITQFHTILSLSPPIGPTTGPPSCAELLRLSVVLLPASEWFYDLPSRMCEDVLSWFPTLPALYSSLVAKWLSPDEGECDLRLHLAVLIGYIYEYLDSAVRLPTFVQQIPVKLRPFHFDQLHGRNTIDLGARRCQLQYI